MKIDDLNELPEWDDNAFRDEEDEEGEGWKPNPTRDLCKAMYVQWNQVMIVLQAGFDSLKEPGPDSLYNQEYIEQHKAILLSDAHQVAVKIRSSEARLVHNKNGERLHHKKERPVYKNFHQRLY